MRISWKIALYALLVTGCAGTRQSTQAPCTEEAAIARGARDGSSGRRASLNFLGSCTSETRPAASAAYRQAFAAARARRHAGKFEASAPDATEDREDVADEALEPSPAALSLPPPVRAPSAVSWVCEVEANSRVFTGVGITRDEALGSAQATCGSHFQASYCTKSDCKQNM